MCVNCQDCEVVGKLFAGLWEKACLFPSGCEWFFHRHERQFSITYDAQYSDKAAEGVIIAQSVKKGESVAQGTQIVLTVSKGIQTEEVPDVGGLDVAEAKKQLEAKGFKVTTVTVYNDGSYKEGTVKSVYGMTPDAKSTAAVGSEVVLQVYGAEQTTTEPESTTKPETTVQEVQ